MDLICFQGTDPQTWPQINALLKKGEWEKIFLIKNKVSESFPVPDNCTILSINTDIPLIDLKIELMKKLKPLIGNGFEFALSIASGSGKEHMALISALLSIPVGIRLVAFTQKGVTFIN